MVDMMVTLLKMWPTTLVLVCLALLALGEWESAAEQKARTRRG